MRLPTVMALCCFSGTCLSQTNTFPSSGHVGIGTISPTHRLEVEAATNSEYLFKVGVAGIAGDYFRIVNATGIAGQFIPAMMGYHVTDNRQALYVTGVIGSTNDVGTEPVMMFDSRQATAAASTRPLFGWDSFGNRKMTISASGNLGIGTSTPSEKLDVNGRIVSRMTNGDGWDISLGTTDGGGLLLGRANGNTSVLTDRAHILYRNGDGGIYYGYNVNGVISTRIDSQVGGNSYFNSGGNVGIGTTAPDAKLSVKGQVHAQEVKVDLNGAVAPDYVFDKDYKLLSLEEIQSYITTNKHLPEVPSAKELEANGMNLGEMNLLLLKKVEELTLYIINQQNQIRSQNEVIVDIQKELSELKEKH